MNGPSLQITPRPSVESYAPEIVVKVEGRELPQDALDDVVELRVTLQKDELGGFSMLLANNFELETQKFRHSDDRRLDVFKPVEIQMGYAGRVKTMFVGEITALQPSFPSSGLPMLNISGTDMLGRLRRSKPGDDKSKAYDDMADWQIVEQIAQRHKLTFSTQSTREGQTNKQVTQRDMDDLQFVMWLAKRNELECSVIIESGKAALYFGKPRDKRDAASVTQVNLTWGESLVSFTPRLTVGSQISKVTVRGWDSRKKDKFQYTAELKDLPRTGGDGKTGAEWIEDKAGAKEERIVDRAVQSEEEAKHLAVQLLTETANQFLTGSGEAMGEPSIRPLTVVHLGGLGARYDGDYYVTKSDHVYGSSGYATTFDVERLREGSAS